MNDILNLNNRKTARTAIVVVSALLAWFFIAAIWPTPELNATQQQTDYYEQRRRELLQRQQQTTQNQTPPHFKSGGERSELILREIADCLKRMDQRLETIEKTCVKINSERALPYNLNRERK